MLVLDKLIILICRKRKEVNVNLRSRKISEFIPKIYYIGDGKSGSSSIMKGFPNIKQKKNLFWLKKFLIQHLISQLQISLIMLYLLHLVLKARLVQDYLLTGSF